MFIPSILSSNLFASPILAEITDDHPVTPKHWFVFIGCVSVLLLLDMFVFHRKAKKPSLKSAAAWTVFWTSLAVGFTIWLEVWAGRSEAIQFITGYAVEWSLSVDNVFVFAVLFNYFGIALEYQYRILFWGILGAIAMRLTFILTTQALFVNFEIPMFTIFGLFLIFTGVKLALSHNKESDPSANLIVRLANRYLRIAKGDHGDKFFIRQSGKLFATTSFLVLLVVEGTDVVFALDSVPAIFGVVEKGPYQTFIVFTSNVFAIMGLRSLYFLLAGIMDMFRYLTYGLSAVLCFIGLKMLVHVMHLMGWVHLKIPPIGSLAIVALLLGTSILASLVAAKRDQKLQRDPPLPDPTEIKAEPEDSDFHNSSGI